jgi:DNA-binding HxlR family transcriptional regulator
MKNKKRKAYCPVDYAFQCVGGKYKGRIIWYLKESVLRYGELKKTVEGISPKMLTQSLKELEKDELIIRKVRHSKPLHVEYTLTATARELIPAIDQMRTWGQRRMNSTSV